MKLEDYKNWNEVILESEFHKYLNELFEKKNKLSRDVFFDILENLGERYSKFYGLSKLTNEEKEVLNSILLEYTNFSDLKQIEELIGTMFDFRLDDYCLFLKNNVLSIKNESIRNEVLNSVEEYEAGEIK